MDKNGADIASLTYAVNFLNVFVHLCGLQMKFPPLTLAFECKSEH